MRVMSVSDFCELVCGKEYDVEEAPNFIKRMHNKPIWWVIELEAYYYKERFVDISAPIETELVEEQELVVAL